jgi:hypothetical protein
MKTYGGVQLLEVSGQVHTPVVTGQEAGWIPEPFWTTKTEKKSCPERVLNPDLSAVQPVAGRYTNNKESFYFVKCLSNENTLK